MSLNHTILGMLSCKPLTGYDLKKIIQDSPFMYWSGNNNQIYKVLMELQDEGFVTGETQHQEGSPTKKVYTITDDGVTELKRWTQNTLPEAPEIKNTFLIQLAWTWQLNNGELDHLLEQYEQEIKGKLFIEKSKKNLFTPSRTLREDAIWSLMYENITDTYAQELSWVQRVRQVVAEFDDTTSLGANDAAENKNVKEESEMMCYQVVESGVNKYVLLDKEGQQVQTEQDSLEIVSICAMNGTNLVLIPGERLPDDFFRLRTGVAGAILQRFTVYNIKVAVVLNEERSKGKFKDFLAESNRGKMFHAYTNMADAEKWLIKTNERINER